MKITQYESQLAAYNAYYSGGGGSVAQNAFAGAASNRPEALARFAGAAAGVGEQALEAYATAQQQRTPVDLVEEGNALEADYADFYADYIANNTGEQAKDAAQHSASFLHQRLNDWYERWQGNPYAQQYIAQHGGRLSARAHAVAEQFAQQEQQAYTQQVFNSKFALAESALGDASLTEEEYAAIRTDLGNTAKALFPEQDTGTLHTAIERRVIGTRLKANLEQQRFAEARQELAGQEALLGEQAPVYAGALRRAEALALARQEEADKQATQAVQQAAVERAYQSLYGPQIAQDSGEAEALLASDETRARFGLDEQGAQQTLGLLRAYEAHTQAGQATIHQQDEQQLLNTVLDLVQGTQGQAADPVAACKAVQASGLDPESKAQVLLALEQGRINTKDEPQRVNALAEAIIRGEERGTDMEMALTRAMAAGQLTHKSRERLLQLNKQIHGPYGPMLQHAYAGLAAQFAQDGLPASAAQQQLAQQHLQAAFNQALTSNNFQELERLSHPDAVTAIAARYRQQPEQQAPEHSINQPQADYLDGFDPLEGPHLSAAQGGSRSDAGRAKAPAKTALAGKPLEKVFILQKKREANWDDDAAGEQKNADKQVQELEDLSKKPDASKEEKRNAIIARVLHPLLSQARAAKPHEVDSQAVYDALVQALDAEKTLSPEDRQFAMQSLRKNNGFLLNLRTIERKFYEGHYQQQAQKLLDNLAATKTEPVAIASAVDAFMGNFYKKVYGYPEKAVWPLIVSEKNSYPERSRLMAQALSAYSETLLATPEGRNRLQQELAPLVPSYNKQAWLDAIKGNLVGGGAVKNKKYIDRLEGYVDHIIATALHYDVPPDLALAVMYQESKGQDDLESGQKAYGLMQIMPDKTTQNISEYFAKQYPDATINGVQVPLAALDYKNPAHNIVLGVLKLKMGLQMHDGKAQFALMDYHDGRERAKKAEYKPENLGKAGKKYGPDITALMEKHEQKSLPSGTLFIHLPAARQVELLDRIKALHTQEQQ